MEYNHDNINMFKYTEKEIDFCTKYVDDLLTVVKRVLYSIFDRIIYRFNFFPKN